MANQKLQYHYYYTSGVQPVPPSAPPPRRRHRGLKVMVVLIILIGAAVHFAGLGHHPHASAKTVAVTSPKVFLSASAMNQQINSIIAQNPTIDIAVSIVDLSTGQTSNFGVTVPFEAASTSKIITAVSFLHAVENGDESLDEQLGGASAQYLLQQMIEQSDNDAWQALNDELGHATLLDYATSIGMQNYNPDANTLPASDMSLLLQKLYKGQLLNSAHTQLLLSYMKQANEADYIPAAVPSGIAVYHKAGLLDDRVHDVAIIDDGHHPYVLAIYTNGHGTYDGQQRTRILRDITSLTLKHFAGQSS